MMPCKHFFILLPLLWLEPGFAWLVVKCAKYYRRWFLTLTTYNSSAENCLSKIGSMAREIKCFNISHLCLGSHFCTCGSNPFWKYVWDATLRTKWCCTSVCVCVHKHVYWVFGWQTYQLAHPMYFMEMLYLDAYLYTFPKKKKNREQIPLLLFTRKGTVRCEQVVKRFQTISSACSSVHSQH